MAREFDTEKVTEKVTENYQPRPGQMATRTFWAAYPPHVAGYGAHARPGQPSVGPWTAPRGSTRRRHHTPGGLTPMPDTGSATRPVRITAAPARGSVVLVHGTTGTAYQRFYSDDLFYPAGRSTGVSFEHLLSLAGDQGVLLVHDASLYEKGCPPRPPLSH
jgi:hypothetical protein